MDEMNEIRKRGGYDGETEKETELNSEKEIMQNDAAEEQAQTAPETAAPAAEQKKEEPPAVDYSVASGVKETVTRRPTVAYNSAPHGDNAGAFAEAPGTDAGAAASAGGEGEGTAFEFVPPEGVSGADETHGKFRKKRQKKPMSQGTKRVIAGVLAVVLCGGAGFGGGALAVKCFGGGAGEGTAATIKIDASDADSLNAASAIAKKVMPSVVGISTVSQTYTQTIFGLQQGTQKGVGTGLIVTEDGYILTNSHVVDDGNSESITVDLFNGAEYTGSVLWSSQDLDLAIVKIDAKGLTAAELGDSDDVEIGDYAVAIGNPLGMNFERSVTQGIISGLDRTITTTDSSTGSTNKMEGLIQTDASINSGNSGGPLINSDGEVIGINSAKASSAEGLGFAIPINTALPIIEEIKESGTYEQTYVGISGMNVAAVKSKYQTDFKADSGIYLVQIYTNSPASKAGLQEGDIITAIDGTDVEDMSAFKKQLVKYRPGDKVKLTVERDKQNITVEVTLEAESSSTQQSLKPAVQENNGSSGSGSSGSQDNGAGNGGTYIDPYSLFGNFFN
ncbi:MAG: S1C family serine protease [Anaerovoracaceae bacterium]